MNILIKKTTKTIVVVTFLMLFIGMKKNSTEKYFMIAYYDTDELSASWYEKNYKDTITIDSGCITNNFTKLDFDSSNSFYRVVFYKYNSLERIENLNNNVISSYQISEFSNLIGLKDYSSFFDQSLFPNETKRIPPLDTTDCLFFQRRTVKKGKIYRFYRVFVVEANKSQLQYVFNPQNNYFINHLDYLTIVSKKHRIRKYGDTLNLEVFNQVKILNEIKGENCYEYKGFNYPPGNLVFYAILYKTTEIYYKKHQYQLDSIGLNSKLNSISKVKNELNEIGKLMNSNSKLSLNIIEFSEYNISSLTEYEFIKQLSQNRINEVKNYLIANFGINERRFKITKKGSTIKNNKERKRKNRKLKLQLIEYQYQPN